MAYARGYDQLSSGYTAWHAFYGSEVCGYPVSICDRIVIDGIDIVPAGVSVHRHEPYCKWCRRIERNQEREASERAAWSLRARAL